MTRAGGAGTTRVLGVELRRGSAPWAAAAGLAVGVILAIEYRGVPAIVIGDSRQLLVVLIPLLLGAGAWHAGRDRRSGMSEVLTTTSRPSWRRRVPIAAAAALGSFAGTAAPVGALLMTGASTGAYTATWMVAAMLVTAAYAAAAALWGLAIGRLVPWRITPPLLVLLGFVSLTTLVILTDPEGAADGRYPADWLLIPASGEGINDFERLTDSVLAGQMVWAFALGVAALVVYLPSGGLRLLAALPVGGGLLLASVLLPQHLHEGVTIDAGATDLVCAPGEPEVCARRAMPGVLDELVEPGREALALLDARLPQAPTRVEAIFYGNDSHVTGPPPDPQVLQAELYLDGRATSGLTRDEILWTLLMGAGTRACGVVEDGGWQEYDAARLVAAAWVRGVEPPAPADGDGHLNWLPPTSVTHPAYDALLALPETEQQARVAELREAELGCEPGDRLGLLVGGAP